MKKWIYLMIANFSGVFNDNFLKNAIVFVATTWTLPGWLTLSQLISLVSASLVLPYIVLSPYSGLLTTRFSKIRIFKFFKLIEFPIMALASLAFIMEWAIIAIISVFLMGIQSCLYSPAKYGLIKDLGGNDESAFGSGLFEAMAFAGILIGTVAASFLSDYGRTWIFIFIFFLAAFLGYFAVTRIKVNELVSIKSKDNKVSINPFVFLKNAYSYAVSLKRVQSAIVGVALFWMIGALLQMNLILHAKNYYLLSNTKTGVIMSVAAIGIAIGTWISGVAASKIKSGRLMIGGLSGMIVSLLIIIFCQIDYELFLLMIFLTTLSAGFFQVPNLAIIQKADSGSRHGELLAYMNLMIFIFVLIASLLFSIVSYVFQENSIAVFAIVLIICVFVLIGVATRKL
ncbi:hypothetical protein MASR2M117_22550 [Paludibacter sp.]